MSTEHVVDGEAVEVGPFPVNSYREAREHLRRPFTPAAVKFKVQSTWPKGNPTGGLVVAYIDARLVSERLNLVCPHLWSDANGYTMEPDGTMRCNLTIDGITRSDVGEGKGKALRSDAFKRAAVKFGVGVSLYAIPQSFIGTQDGTAKAKNSNSGPTLVLTDVGERKIRDAYRKWLASVGIQAFGEPLDHGDVEDSQGDAEAESHHAAREASAPSPAPVKAPAKRGKAAPTEDRPVPQEQGEAILARVKALGPGVAAALHAWCDENKVPAGDKFTDRLAGMTATQGLALQKWLAEATA